MTPNRGYRLHDLRVSYDDKTALSLDQLNVSEGEALAVVGPSGAGKTTLLRVLGLALRPSAGTVELGGVPSTQFSSAALRQRRVDIGFVHQDFRLVPNLRVLQNVLCGRLGRMSLLASLRALTLPQSDDVRAVHALLERVGIADKLYQRCDNLSGGEQQRVAIARALYQQPRILLADEPISNVDPARADETVRLLVDICREDGLTFCASMHNVELARALFPRVIGLRHGRIVFDRATEDIDNEEIAALYRLPAKTESRLGE
jgi:phosphonate transport system ATP-binding protein